MGRSPGSGGFIVKSINRRALFDRLWTQKSASILELEQSTGLSRPTVTRLIREMIDDNLVIPCGKGLSSGGRTPILYSVNASASYAIGIDLEFPVVRVAVSDLEGTPIDGLTESLDPKIDKDMLIEKLFDMLDGLIERAGVSPHRLLGIGIGLPGILDTRSNYSVSIDRIAGWKDVPVGRMISGRYKVPVRVRNDVHMLAFAEKRLYVDKRKQNLLFVAVRSGVGMSIQFGGKIFSGESGNAGYLGHTVVEINGLPCQCGNRGCLEMYTNERAICDEYARLTGQTDLSAYQVAELSEQGAQPARAVMRRVGTYFGVGIGNAANLLDLTDVILSARFPLTTLISDINDTLNARVNRIRSQPIQVCASRLTESQYALGGCFLITDNYRAKQ